MDYSLLETVNQLWLKTLRDELTPSLKAEGMGLMFMPSEIDIIENRPLTENDDFVILFPMSQWTPLNNPDRLAMNFRIGIKTSEGPEQILVAHYKNCKIQQLLAKILYAPEKALFETLSGFGGPYQLSIGESGLVLEYDASPFLNRSDDTAKLSYWETSIETVVYG